MDFSTAMDTFVLTNLFLRVRSDCHVGVWVCGCVCFRRLQQCRYSDTATWFVNGGGSWEDDCSTHDRLGGVKLKYGFT